MNALPVGPEQLMDPDSRVRYFEDLEKLGFDVAYSAYYASPHEDVTQRFRQAYVEFAQEARRRGYPACVQIQMTVCAGDRVGIEEAQYDVSNKPERWGKKGFFASFSSDTWKNYLKELTELFVRDYGYEWVVFEEPMYRVDIPGTKDRFHEKFAAEHPEVAYPELRAETSAYLTVQQAKLEALTSFCRDLVEHAKSVGAQRVGVMPWFFIPTTENTPEGTLNTSCDVGRIAQIPDLDFLVARMQVDNIHAGVMRTGDEMEKSAGLEYIEVMAHALGKDVIAVNNPTDEHAGPDLPLIPLEFYRDATVAALAAAPTGFTRHWYGQNHGKDDAHMSVLAEAAGYAGRLGQPQSPLALVVSANGAQHAEPWTNEAVFGHYWAAAKRLAFEAHVPLLTFHGETLAQNLADHPEVQVLIFDGHFPQTVEHMMVISDWWEDMRKRAVLAFASGLGYVADPNLPGPRPCTQSLPGVFELIGLKQEEDPQFGGDKPVGLRDVARVRRSAFLGDDLALGVSKVANLRRVFGSRAIVLYEVDNEEAKIPVVAEWRDKTTLAVFCGFGLSEETAAAAEKAIRYALREVDSPPLWLDECGQGILWSATKNNYLVVSNISDKAAEAVIRPGRCTVWDSRQQKMLSEDEPRIKIKPHSFGIYRIVGRRSKFFDIIGTSCLRSVIDGAGRAEIALLAGQKTVLVLRASPKEILVDGRPSTISQEVINGAYHVTLQQCAPGEHGITLRW